MVLRVVASDHVYPAANDTALSLINTHGTALQHVLLRLITDTDTASFDDPVHLL